MFSCCAYSTRFVIRQDHALRTLPDLSGSSGSVDWTQDSANITGLRRGILNFSKHLDEKWLAGPRLICQLKTIYAVERISLGFIRKAGKGASNSDC